MKLPYQWAKELVKSYNNTDWKEYINFSERRYTRNLVYKSDLFGRDFSKKSKTFQTI